MELILAKPIEELVNFMIEFNNEEIKKELVERLERYNTTVYDDKQISLAKSDRATLNKFLGAIEDERKRIKKAYLKPYEDFEVKVKELTQLVMQPISVIDTQVKEFESKIKLQKKGEIENFYIANINELKNLLPLEKIFKSEWLNTTYKLKDIQNEILLHISRIQMDLKVIADLKNTHETHLKDFYLNCLDLSRTLAEKTRIEEQEKKIQSVAVSPQSIPAEPEVKSTGIPEFENRKIVQIDFRVWATKEQLDGLKNYMKQNKIEYGKVAD